MKTSDRFNNAEKPWLIIILFIGIYYALLYAFSFIMEYPATYALIGVNGLVFLAIHLKKLEIKDLSSSYFLSVKGKQSYRIMSSAFTHEHPLHILFNMYSLSNIGPALETLLGRQAFFASYLLLIIIAGRISVALKKKKSPYTSSIGASGAICGLMGILISMIGIYNPYNLKYFLPTIALLIIMSFSKHIDSVGHFCGLLTGIIMGFLMLSFMY
ncbi:MAG: rhomboid family intramembrane serine protease [Lachnospiraceae bacterium]|nr:rhomboid family intramembrane serine protease [Lachnospiraceae bacterium]